MSVDVAVAAIVAIQAIAVLVIRSLFSAHRRERDAACEAAMRRHVARYHAGQHPKPVNSG